ncbi:hypothetical protein TRIUR3_21105 [Triticum urartu]|uniref:Uncharacterized protein n=1 Tax=Triticum urartu TaxID=4572 RepID=M7ZH91_TRIUA|nr:hypothetical protein TRIUR3_21105 [Triticum urartu]
MECNPEEEEHCKEIWIRPCRRARPNRRPHFLFHLRVLLVAAPALHGQGEKGGMIGGAEFFRKDSVVGNMDGYLSYLSLEYDFFSDTNPAWVSSFWKQESFPHKMDEL